jgi:hypothetical protein
MFGWQGSNAKDVLIQRGLGWPLPCHSTPVGNDPVACSVKTWEVGIEIEYNCFRQSTQKYFRKIHIQACTTNCAVSYDSIVRCSESGQWITVLGTIANEQCYADCSLQVNYLACLNAIYISYFCPPSIPLHQHLNHLPVLHCLEELKWSASYACQSDWLQFNILVYNILQSKREKRSCNRMTHSSTHLFRHPKVVNKKAAPNEESGDSIAKLHVYLTALGSQQKNSRLNS